MKSMFYLWATAFVAINVFGQTNETGLPTGFDPGQFPTGNAALLALIPPITALITWLIGKIPPLPKWLLPWTTPVLGIGVGYVLQYLSSSSLSPTLTAMAGGLAVFIYETVKAALVDKQNKDASIITPTPVPKPKDTSV